MQESHPSPSAKSAVKNSPAFTMLELLVAMAVFSLLIVLLLGMVDGATKLWRGTENRVEAYREARAALGIISRDLRNALAGTNTNYILINTPAFDLLSDAEKNTNSAGAIFFLSAQPPGAQASSNKSDVCQVGYFLAYGNTTMISGPLAESSMNLYRYFLSSDATFAKLTNGSLPVFRGSLTPTDADVELLARNIKSFRVSGLGTNGTAYTPTPNAPLPSLVQIEVTALNQETAKKLTTKTMWTHATGGLTNVVNQNQQTFTTRVRLPKTQ